MVKEVSTKNRTKIKDNGFYKVEKRISHSWLHIRIIQEVFQWTEQDEMRISADKNQSTNVFKRTKFDNHRTKLLAV